MQFTTTTTTTNVPSTAALAAVDTGRGKRRSSNATSQPHDEIAGPESGIQSETEGPSAIVGGTEPELGSFPFLVGLAIGPYMCGGSLIAKKYVLTAAHCVDGYTGVENAGQLYLYFGAHDSSWNDATIVRGVVQATKHPDYDSYSMVNDVAIVELDQAVDTITPVQLQPTPFASNHDFTGSNEATIMGWGTVYSDGPMPDVLQYAAVDLVSAEMCGSSAYDYGAGLIFDDMLCAEKSGIDSCQGDSGGPMMLGDTQVGVVSWGYGCASAGLPGVYASVGSHFDWINDMVGGDLSTSSNDEQHWGPCQPPCEPETGACVNGGTGTLGLNTAGVCECDCSGTHYNGASCATPLPCSDFFPSCQNGGEPNGVTGSCGCDCSTGFVGPLCETCVPTTGECLNGGSSFYGDGHGSGFGSGSGSVADSGSGSGSWSGSWSGSGTGMCRCECAAGFEGVDCGKEVDCVCKEAWMLAGLTHSSCSESLGICAVEGPCVGSQLSPEFAELVGSNKREPNKRIKAVELYRKQMASNRKKLQKAQHEMTRIVGGTEANVDEYPWMVGLIVGEYMCGGSLISSTVVLTAAHCVAGLRAQYVTAYLGSTDSAFSSATDVHQASAVHVHPEYVAVVLKLGAIFDSLEVTNDKCIHMFECG
jgi:secreted trypsin-like serine protease